MRGRKQTVYLAVFCAVLIAAVSASLAWVFLGPGNDSPRVGNGSYQVRSADALENSGANDFREDLEGVEPGRYRTEGSIRTGNNIGVACYYVLLQFAGSYPSWTSTDAMQEFWTRGPATLTLPVFNDFDLPRGGFYSRDCQPWERVE